MIMLTGIKKIIKMKLKIRSLKVFSNTSGSTLMEFAVVTGLMAILAVTGMPKLSIVGESARMQKSKQELDKLGSQALNYYQEKAVTEGRGRFPGQTKYNVKVGGHSTENDILSDLVGINQQSPTFLQYNGTDGSDWVSVFGSSNSDNPSPSGVNLANDNTTGTNDWKTLFGENILSSPFQDGHYVFQVVAGSSSGSRAQAPVLYIADLENPSQVFVEVRP